MTEDPKLLQALVKRKEQECSDLRIRIDTVVAYLELMRKSPDLTQVEKDTILTALDHLTV
jgi:hypothetical protein